MTAIGDELTIQTILLSFADPTNNGAGHHNVVFAERQIEALIEEQAKLARKQNDTVNRFELVDHTENGEGREFVKWEKDNFKVEYRLQDGGRTLKVFLSDLEASIKERSEG